MKTIVIYYSRKGSNKYLADKLAADLKCPLEAIRPRNGFYLLMMAGLNFGIKPLKHTISEFDRVILTGPIWMGSFIYPLKKFVHKYKASIKELVFVTCSGSSYEKKDEQYGHGLVFKQVMAIPGLKCNRCEALPID